MRVTKEVILEKSDAEWFESTYPRGSFSWLFSQFLKEFRELHKSTPQDYIRLGAAELKKAIEG